MPIVTDSDGSSTVITGSGRGSSRSAIVSPIVTSARPGERDDLAGPGLRRVDAVERLGHVELADLSRAAMRAVGAAPGDRLAAADRAVAHAAEREAADVGRRVEVGDVRLERVRGVVDRRRDVLEQQVHQRREVVGEVRPARARRGRPCALQ